MKLIKYITVVLCVFLLWGCGGGGGNAEKPAEATANSAVGSFVFNLDKTSISNGGSNGALLTVTVLDGARNVLKDVPVLVSVDSGLYSPLSTKTDNSGQVSGNISIGSDKSNRKINATIVVAGQSAKAVVEVVGSKITLTALPSTPSPGARVDLVVKTTDANGAAISGAEVQLGGTLGFSQLVKTDLNGSYSISLPAAPQVLDAYTVTATGLGVSSNRTVQVVGAGTGIPNAVGVISSASMAVTPNSVAPNSEGSSTNRANIRAIFQDGANQSIKNVRVRFAIASPGLGNGEQITTGSTTLYTDVAGVVAADYIPGTRTSPTNGVRIIACYGYTDADVSIYTDADIAEGRCIRSIFATLTVAGRPLSITLGDNNLLAKGGESLTYIKKFDIAVADASGNAVANAVVSATVDITHYGKGTWPNRVTTTNPTTGVVTTDWTSIWCLNEDTDRNGFLDSAEKINGDGNDIISPRKADVILSFTGTNVTAANGRLIVQVEYPQNVATWLTYSLTATTTVAGSEGAVTKSYVTEFVEGDDKNGSFRSPPYGRNDCRTPN